MPDLVFLDFEASILGREGYPTEVAYMGPKGKWTALIKPLPHWTAWDPAEEKQTGISRDMLAKEGLDPRDVCEQLEAGVVGLIAYITHPFDAKWLRVLASHSMGRNERVIASNAYSLWGPDGMKAYKQFLVENPPKRRALDEANAAWTFHQKVYLPGEKPEGGGEAGWGAFQVKT